MERTAPAFEPLLFDLDGTIANTYPGIVAAAQAAFEAVGLPSVTAEQVTPLTGKGVRALVEGLLEAVGAPVEGPQRDRALAVYQQTYERTCAQGAYAYPGMVELLGRLPGPKALLTNKPRRYTEQIAKALDFGRHLDTIVAGDDAGQDARMRLKPDPWPIEEALRRLRCGPERAILVGDTKSDAGAARAAGIACCLVRWGHGGPDALAGAARTAADVGELERLLLGATVSNDGACAHNETVR